MILPNKYVREDKTLLGLGAYLLQALNKPKHMSELWTEVKSGSSVGSFERFVLALDMLFIFGLIDIDENRIARVLS